MNTRTPFVAVSISLIALFSLACGGVGERLDELGAQGDLVTVEAESAGMSTDQEGCLTVALDRSAACAGGLMEKGSCQAMAQIYLQGCLNTSAESGGFCDGVPTDDQMLDTVNWGVAQCDAAGRLSEQGCTNVQQTRAGFCNR